MFGSICLSIRLSVRQRSHYARVAEWLIYGLGLPSASENHHDTWDTVQDPCVFVSNQETFAIKSCVQRLRAFNTT